MVSSEMHPWNMITYLHITDILSSLAMRLLTFVSLVTTKRTTVRPKEKAIRLFI